jgi:putative DNA primase/helicase
VLFTYAFNNFDVGPYIAVTSPQPQCGKSLLFDLLATVIYRPLRAINITPAAVFRTVDAIHPALLIDEGDTFLENEELRGVLNGGHRRAGALIVRTVPTKDGDYEPRLFDVWGPKAIALIGNLPHTLAQRSIHVPMQRRMRNEKVLRLRVEQEFAAMREFRSRCLRWANDNATALRHADPALPEAVENRRADNWRALVAIADIAGSGWPSAARALAAEENVLDSSAAVQLLEDLQALFQAYGPRLPSNLIIEKLGEMEHRLWPEWNRGQPITASGLSRLLKPFGVGPTTIRQAGNGKGAPAKGYKLEDLEPVFGRYLKVNSGSGAADDGAPVDAGTAPGEDEVI